MIATAHELQARLKPAAIAGDAVETAKRKGEELAEDAADAVRGARWRRRRRRRASPR